MKKRKHIPTSKAANDSMEGSPKKEQYKKIKEALKEMKNGGMYEEVAKVAGLEPVAVGRRFSEMRDLKMIYACDYTRKTSKNREAVVHQLIGLGYKNIDGTPVNKKPESKKEPSDLPEAKKIKKQIELF